MVQLLNFKAPSLIIAIVPTEFDNLNHELSMPYLSLELLDREAMILLGEYFLSQAEAT